ncbi:transmembrane protein 69-like isoform 1-T2 [Pholidichthys leucotaenia]
MISVLFRRSSSAAAQKVSLWAGPQQRCWTSALTGTSGGASTSSNCGSSIETAPLKPSIVRGFGRSLLFQWSQPQYASHLMRHQHFHSSAVRLKKRAKPEPPPRELDLLRYDVKDFGKSPKPALYLGFAGLIPLVSPTLFMAVTESYYPELAYAQLAYTAAIISFLGGARWGFALPESSPAKPDWLNLANSVVLPLLACVTMLMSDSIVPATSMVIMGFGITLHYDLALLPTYPSWFKVLRTVLTVVAVFSLVGTLLMNSVHPERKIFKD